MPSIAQVTLALQSTLIVKPNRQRSFSSRPTECTDAQNKGKKKKKIH
jgi:hypothetical protein